MTNLQLLQHLIGNIADLTEGRLQIALELEGLTHSDEYSSDNKCLIYKIAIQEIQTFKGIKSETEGGYSITYTDSAVPGALVALANNSGCADLIAMFNAKPKIKNKSYLW